MDEKDEGQRAYWRGNELHDNPYPHNSLPGREWDKGYWGAVDEDEDRREPDCATLSDRVREPRHYHRLWHPARQYSVPVNRGCRKRRRASKNNRQTETCGKGRCISAGGTRLLVRKRARADARSNRARNAHSLISLTGSAYVWPSSAFQPTFSVHSVQLSQKSSRAA
jgi:hypothetical protein